MTQVSANLDFSATPSTVKPLELRAAALAILASSDVKEKLEQCSVLKEKIIAGLVVLDTARSFADDVVFNGQTPGRPTKPVLLSALKVPRRRSNTFEGRLAMLHALVHIEFTAINLALDAMVRFSGLPSEYYWDWWSVSLEEVYHFMLLNEHLQSFGANYGDFPAHDGLWEMANKTSLSLADRMAMIPRTLEARGLDACPLMRDKLKAQGDEHGASLIDIILRDEVGHVAIGNRWFLYACEQNNQNPITLYKAIAVQHNAPRLRPPFNLTARRAAGFFEEELSALAAL